MVLIQCCSYKITNITYIQMHNTKTLTEKSKNFYILRLIDVESSQRKLQITIARISG